MSARCICTELVSVTERSALAAGRCLGSGDPQSAIEGGYAAAKAALDLLPIDGRVIVGGPEGQLPEGQTVGAGGAEYELAVDCVQGDGIVARGGTGAISIVAAGAPGSMRSVPRVYMKKLAVGPTARGQTSISAPVAEVIDAVAAAFRRKPGDITAIILDRPRHDDLVEEVRRAGARIKLIADGDITAAISASIRGTNDHLALGIGGAREAVITAAALRCLGGEVQAQFWPRSRTEIRLLAEHGFDPEEVLTTEDFVRGDAIVVATGISNGDFLRGVRYLEEGGRTHSIVLCSRCNIVRFIDTSHHFTTARRLEVRI